LSKGDEQITVQSVTGVDLTLGIAGPGTRSYAFVIDWHIRAIVAAAWLLMSYYVFDVALTVKSAAGFLSILPASIIYFLYHPILEVALQGPSERCVPAGETRWISFVRWFRPRSWRRHRSGQ
jgi:hypothetical protein